MSDQNHNKSGDRPNLPAVIAPPGTLLDTALAQLPPEQRQALTQKALERQLDIDAKVVEADNRHRASTADMANTIHQVRALEGTTKSDYSVRAEYETGSGRTTVEVKKSNNTVIIVIAIVVAVLALMMFAN